jgi:protein SCO1/2
LFGLFACNNLEESLPYYNAANFEPIFLKNNESVEKSIPHKIESFTLLNQDGVDFGSENLKGKIHVANFIFTSCTHICPKMTTNMTAVENEFLDDSELSLVSYTVTPWIDSPEVLKRYKEEFTQNSNNWIFLTGKKAEIYSIARKSYFAEEEIGFTKDSTDFLHTEHFLLVDKSLRIRGIYNGTLGLEMEQLIKDINTLKK